MIIRGRLEGLPPTAAGVDLRWLAGFSLQLTDAPPWYSTRARMGDGLCGSCDLGLLMGCTCPPCDPLPILTKNVVR